MADYRFSAKVIKRSNGQSAVAAAAYRAGERLLDDRTGQTSDYSRKAGVIHAEVMTPEGTPNWMHDRAQLWNAVEAVERR
ncbi:MobA/MobL family protein, partial [Litoreibacter halocynthiae]|uniref:MobA/MobL family protein n=1 Tax=Litoreibacter halocynthiae TaxID=1242689 RepID=UPI002490A4CC